MPIVIEKLTYKYQSGSVNEFTALKDIDLTIQDGEFLGVIGHTGSGKSTLIQQLNGLMQPTSGKVTVDGFDMNDKKQRMKGRALVGMVFQYPDHQLRPPQHEATRGRDRQTRARSYAAGGAR